MTTNAILEQQGLSAMPGDDHKWWQAVLARDAAQDGQFVFAVSSTGVFCRPSCAAKHPRRENVTFYRRAEEAQPDGHRARPPCRPKAATGSPPMETVKSI